MSEASRPPPAADPADTPTPADEVGHDGVAAVKRKRRRRRRKPPASDPTAPAVANTATPTATDTRSAPTARPVSPEPASVDRLARDVVTALDRLVGALAEDQGFKAALPTKGAPQTTDDLVVSLATGIFGRTPSDIRESAQHLLAQMRERVTEAIRGATAFHQGHVYCFFTDQPESPYSAPPHAVDVFAGYAPNGKPEWVGFTNLCIARREPQVDRIFADQPDLIALTQTSTELTEGLLPGFGRGSLAWTLHGQVVCGLVPRDLNVRSRVSERIALTLQIIEVRQQTTGNRLILNMIGMTPFEVAEIAAASDPTSSAEAFRRLIRATRERVENLGRRAAIATRRGESFDIKTHVDAMLTRLRSDVLRVFKSRDHRTRHAEERHQSGERPTALAITDALQTTDARLYRDDQKDTIVVLGPKNRVHVFSRIGRHITSLELQPHDVARRVDLGRWKSLERHAADIFRHMLKGQLEPT